MIDVAFVILHYRVINKTIECINSIKKNIDVASYRIIVVNNDSPDNSKEQLNNLYCDDSAVILMNADRNLGFARGNNLGYEYAKNNLKARFIVLTNNDVIMLEKHFYYKIEQAYNKFGFAVLGPMIITKDLKCCSNPKFDRIPTIEQLDNRMEDYKKRLWILKKGLGRAFNFYLKLKSFYYKKDFKYDWQNYIHRQFDVKLHGSFLVFSPIYVEISAGLNPNTFMYLEEDILRIETKKKKMLMMYEPNIIVFHEEDCSTDESYGCAQKEIFIFSNLLDSMKVYYPLIKEYWDEEWRENGE